MQANWLQNDQKIQLDTYMLIFVCSHYELSVDQAYNDATMLLLCSLVVINFSVQKTKAYAGVKQLQTSCSQYLI